MKEYNDFIERILKIDPKERPSAATLIDDEWFKDVLHV